MASKNDSGLTLAIIGCGNLGSAILSGVLESLKNPDAAPSEYALPKRVPTKFLACVRSPKSKARLEKTYADYADNVTVIQGDNVRAVREADVVILGCKPYMINDVLPVEGMFEALKGKLLLSILAGVPVPQLQKAIFGEREIDPSYLTVVRTIPNTGAGVRTSMTVCAVPTPALTEDETAIINWIYSRVGKVEFLPPHLMDAVSSLCGSGPAFFALVLEAAADGAVAMGVPRAEAQRMAAQTMKGAAELVLQGEHPTILREKVSTPGGCTIGGLLVLEEGGVRGSVARAVREGTVVAAQLGKGTQGVNGTRFFPN